MGRMKATRGGSLPDAQRGDLAITLAAALDEAPSTLSPTETALLKDWLNRLSAP
jgi:hypothetical protein